jgi:lipid A 3-O-deacylase
MRRLGLLALVLMIAPFAPAYGAGAQQAWPMQAVQPVQTVEPIQTTQQAQTSQYAQPAQSVPAAPAQKIQLAQMPGQPDLVSFGVTDVDFDKSEPRTQSTDFRLEYRWGASLASAQTNWLDFAIHPLAGFEFSTRSQLYGFGGLGFDFLLWRHLVFTESETVGLFDSGDAKPLGSFIEFRSQAELGWRFDNDMRVTAAIAHISNAGLTHRNPGEEMIGGYLHIPVGTLFGR